MLRPLRIAFERPLVRAAEIAARMGRCVDRLRAIMGLMVGFATLSGCAVFGHRGPTADDMSTARELSRQGVAAIESGQPQQAEDLLKKSLATLPDDATAHHYMAEALWNRGARDQAIVHIEDAARLDPTDATIAMRAGEMAFAMGHREQAIHYAERAIRLDPKLAGGWSLRARCFRQLNQPDRALADLQRAVELAPDNTDLLLDIASIYRQRGENERCLTAIYRLLDAYPTGNEPQSVLVMEGLTLLDLARPQQATEAFVAAIQHGPPNADLYFYLAESYSSAGRSDEAVAAAQQALAINGEHNPSRQLLAQLASRTSVVGRR